MARPVTRPQRLGRALTARPFIMGVVSAPSGPRGRNFIIHGSNFNLNARRNRVRLPVRQVRQFRQRQRRRRFGRRRRFRSRRTGWQFVRANWVNPQGTQLRVTLPRNFRGGYIMVHNGRKYSPYFRYWPRAAFAPQRGRVVAGAQGIVPNLRNQPVGRALSMLQRAGLRPGGIGFLDTGNCGLAQRIAAQGRVAGQRLRRGSRVNLSVYWCRR